MKVYIVKNNLKVKEEKVIFFNEKGENRKNKIIKLKISFSKRLNKLREILHV